MIDKNIEQIQFWPPNENEEIDFRIFWKVIQNRRWFIFTVAAIALAFAAVYSFRLPDIYTAHTRILFEYVSDKSALKNPEMLQTESQYGPVYYQTQAEMLKSRNILEQAVEQADLMGYYKKTFNQTKTKEELVGILDRKMDVKLVKGTQLIELSVSDHDPKMAAQLANTIAEIFLKESWRERLFISDQLLQWFPEEGKTLKDSSPMNQLKELDKQDMVMSLPSVLQDSVVSSLKQSRLDVDAQMEEFSKRYTSEHPKMKELTARAAYLESAMKLQIQKIITSLKSGLAGEFSVTNIKIAETAEVPRAPSGPKRLSIILFSTFLSLLGSSIFAILLFYLDQNIRSEEDIRKVPLVFLGYLPLIAELEGLSKGGSSKTLVDQVVSDTRLIDEVTNIRTSILFSMPAEKSKLFMCTSAMPEEGKTTVVSMLGIALAEAGEKVLLIDADMRRPALHQVFGLENKEGLSNCLIGSTHPKKVARIIEKVPNLHVITAGEKTPNPAVLLGSESLNRLIREVENDYTKIIFDAPPALHIADGLILTSRVHGTILIFHGGKIHQNVAKRMKDRIQSAGGVLVGGIINRVDYKRLDYSYYRYYRQYSKYYQKSNSEIEETSSYAN